MPGSALRTAVLAGHARTIFCMEFSRTGTQLASGSIEGLVRTWCTTTGVPLWELRGHEGGVLSVDFSPDGRCLISGGGKTVRIWDLNTGEQLNCLEFDWGVLSVAYSELGDKFGVITFNGRDSQTFYFEASALSPVDGEGEIPDLGTSRASQASVGKHNNPLTTLTMDGHTAFVLKDTQFVVGWYPRDLLLAPHPGGEAVWAGHVGTRLLLLAVEGEYERESGRTTV